jgi:hypothetical protein
MDRPCRRRRSRPSDHTQRAEEGNRCRDSALGKMRLLKNVGPKIRELRQIRMDVIANDLSLAGIRDFGRKEIRELHRFEPLVSRIKSKHRAQKEM